MKLMTDTIKIYNDYEEIPWTVADYILSVSDADNIYEIPLDEINDFLYNLEDHCKTANQE